MKKHTTLKLFIAVSAGLLGLVSTVNAQISKINQTDSLYLPGRLTDAFDKPVQGCELTIIYNDTGSEYDVHNNYEFAGVGNVSREISTELKMDAWGYFFITVPKRLFNKQVTLSFYTDGYKPYATTFTLSHFTPYLGIKMQKDSDEGYYSVRGEPTEYIIDGKKIATDSGFVYNADGTKISADSGYVYNADGTKIIIDSGCHYEYQNGVGYFYMYDFMNGLKVIITTIEPVPDPFKFPVMDNHLPYPAAQYEGDAGVILPPLYARLEFSKNL